MVCSLIAELHGPDSSRESRQVHAQDHDDDFVSSAMEKLVTVDDGSSQMNARNVAVDDSDSDEYASASEADMPRFSSAMSTSAFPEVEVPARLTSVDLILEQVPYEFINVSRGSTHEVELSVQRRKQWVVWRFEVEDRDVDLTIHFVPTHEGEVNRQTIRSTTRYRAMPGERPVEGLHNCTGPGTMTFVWDNSYSWMRSKRIRFQARVVDATVKAAASAAADAYTKATTTVLFGKKPRESPKETVQQFVHWILHVAKDGNLDTPSRTMTAVDFILKRFQHEMAEQIYVPRRWIHHVTVAMEERDQFLVWRFEVEDHDIDLTVHFVPTEVEGEAAQQVIHRTTRYGATRGERPVQGMYKSTEPGVATFVWNNAYSRARGKNIRFQAQVVQPRVMDAAFAATDAFFEAESLREEELSRMKEDERGDEWIRITAGSSVTSANHPSRVIAVEFILYALPLANVYVPKKSSHEVNLTVDGPDPFLVWRFDVEDHDIDFTIHFSPATTAGASADGQVRFRVIHPTTRYGSAPGKPIQGLYACSGPGMATLVWNNQYSRVRGKNIRYQAQVVQGTPVDAAVTVVEASVKVIESKLNREELKRFSAAKAAQPFSGWASVAKVLSEQSAPSRQITLAFMLHVFPTVSIYVPKRASHEVAVDVTHENRFLLWNFAVDDHDIDFTIRFMATGNTQAKDSQVIHPTTRYGVAPGKPPVQGVFKCTGPGTATFVWNNSYSRMRGKNIRYQAYAVHEKYMSAAMAAAEELDKAF